MLSKKSSLACSAQRALAGQRGGHGGSGTAPGRPGDESRPSYPSVTATANWCTCVQDTRSSQRSCGSCCRICAFESICLCRGPPARACLSAVGALVFWTSEADRGRAAAFAASGLGTFGRLVPCYPFRSCRAHTELAPKSCHGRCPVLCILSARGVFGAGLRCTV